MRIPNFEKMSLNSLCFRKALPLTLPSGMSQTKNSIRFESIKVEGETLSETIIRERR